MLILPACKLSAFNSRQHSAHTTDSVEEEEEEGLFKADAVKEEEEEEDDCQQTDSSGGCRGRHTGTHRRLCRGAW